MHRGWSSNITLAFICGSQVFEMPNVVKFVYKFHERSSETEIHKLVQTLIEGFQPKNWVQKNPDLIMYGAFHSLFLSKM